MELLILNAKGRLEPFDAGEKRDVFIAGLFPGFGVRSGADLVGERGVNRLAVEERLRLPPGDPGGRAASRNMLLRLPSGRSPRATIAARSSDDLSNTSELHCGRLRIDRRDSGGERASAAVMGGLGQDEERGAR
jgi:hypothetical protein